jgi:DNA-binding MarR family transcriptional regulator
MPSFLSLPGLAGAGLVRRRRHEQDRRQVHVELTDLAIKETMKFYGPIATEGSAILAAMSITEKS